MPVSSQPSPLVTECNWAWCCAWQSGGTTALHSVAPAIRRSQQVCHDLRGYSRSYNSELPTSTVGRSIGPGHGALAMRHQPAERRCVLIRETPPQLRAPMSCSMCCCMLAFETDSPWVSPITPSLDLIVSAGAAMIRHPPDPPTRHVLQKIPPVPTEISCLQGASRRIFLTNTSGKQ